MGHERYILGSGLISLLFKRFARVNSRVFDVVCVISRVLPREWMPQVLEKTSD